MLHQRETKLGTVVLACIGMLFISLIGCGSSHKLVAGGRDSGGQGSGISDDGGDDVSAFVRTDEAIGADLASSEEDGFSNRNNRNLGDDAGTGTLQLSQDAGVTPGLDSAPEAGGPTCLETTPLWNSTTKQCEPCPQAAPLWSPVAQQCGACPLGTSWNATIGKCLCQQERVMCGELCEDPKSVFRETFTVVCTSSGLVCSPPHKVVFRTQCMTRLTLSYTASPRHCSDVAVEVSLNGVIVATSQFLSANMSTGDLPLGTVPEGTQVLNLVGIGRVGGCNSGSSLAWEGSLVLTLEPIP